MELLLVVLVLVLLGFAASHWGANSVEDFNHSEWTRRKEWRGLARR